MNAVGGTVEARQAVRIGAVAGEVLAALRLALTLRFDARRVSGSDAGIAVLASVAALLWAALGRYDIRGSASFEPSGFAEAGALAAAALGLAWLMSRLSQPTLPLRYTSWLMAGYLPVIAAIGWLLMQPLP